ncbi:MAG: response regulator [Dehalococcoidia bacterium]|nr:response regulator [Dehalococcoidia bacterium]
MVSENLLGEMSATKRVMGSNKSEPSPVLIVDDDRTMIGFLDLALSLDGYKCVNACNGREAMKRVIEREPAIILLDLAMPVMDGEEFYRWLRGSGRTEVPVILMTANQNGMKTCRDLGAQAFLTKPFDLTELEAQVSRFIGGAGGV